jgi:uncharacterized membrane protein YhdT
VAVGLTAKGAAPWVLFAGAAKLIVWFALATVKVRVTGAAGLKPAFPAWFAVSVHAPAAASVTVVAATVQTPSVLLVRATGSPEDAIGLTAKGASP